MKRAIWFLVLVAFVFPVFMLNCSGEKTEDDWVDDLRDSRTRAPAMLYVQEHRVKKAVPILLNLVKKRYWTVKAIYTLGIIGDPVAVPPLIEVLKEVATMDSPDNDRLTEQICMSLGMIGETSAVDSLLWTIDKAGEMGVAGAVQALGKIGDPRGAKKLIEVLKDESKKLVIRHYAAIALGKIKAKEAADAMVYALFVDDKTGLNLFRDGQLSLIQIGGEAARKALIKGYELKNEDTMALAKKIKLDEDWIRIKCVNVMGLLRDPGLADFLMGEFDKGFRNDLVFELFAKTIQAIERTPLKKKHLSRVTDAFINRPQGTEFLNEREIMTKALIFNNYKDRVDDLMKVAEVGDIKLKHPNTGKFMPFSQWCFAAANAASFLGDHTIADRFEAFSKSGRCNAKIFGQRKTTKALLGELNQRVQASKKCGTDLACWVKLLESPKWAEREKAIFVLANTGDKKYMDNIMWTLAFPNEQVRRATAYAIWKLATPDHLPKLLRFWQDQKINKEFQKVTEEIGYVLHIKMRDWNLDGPKERKELFDKVEKLNWKASRKKSK